MKQVVYKIVIPLTVIMFASFTKYWYVLVVDGPDEMLSGFPFPFVCRGWHTSLSLQVFISEFIIDLAVYFLLLFAISFFLYWLKPLIKIPKIVTVLLYSISVVIILISSLIAANPDNLFFKKRHFDMEVMETGYRFIFQHTAQPDFYKYHPEKKVQ